MAIAFDRKVYFDHVRASLFGGSLSQQQVDGQNAILADWERRNPAGGDLRHLAYPLATTFHETGSKMWPIEEYGKGEGHEYGEPDPETGQAYYGRGFVQLTWKDNYQKATTELGLPEGLDLVWHPEHALDSTIAAEIMFEGMEEGWFRGDSKGRHTLDRYFSAGVDDPYNARSIINGDKTTVPSWSNGVSIGKLVEGYHDRFHDALEAAQGEANDDGFPDPEPEAKHVLVAITQPAGVTVTVTVNGEILNA